MEKNNKTTLIEENEKKNIVNRISRIEGQLRGVKKMFEDDSYCYDVLVQLSAIENSVKSLSNQVLENHLNSCVASNLKQDNIEMINELINLFKKFNK